MIDSKKMNTNRLVLVTDKARAMRARSVDGVDSIPANNPDANDCLQYEGRCLNEQGIMNLKLVRAA